MYVVKGTTFSFNVACLHKNININFNYSLSAICVHKDIRITINDL